LFIADKYNIKMLMRSIIVFFVLIGIIILSAFIYVMLRIESKEISAVIKNNIGSALIIVVLLVILS